MDVESLVAIACGKMLSGHSLAKDHRTDGEMSLPDVLPLENSSTDAKQNPTELATTLEPGFDLDQETYLDLEGGNRLAKLTTNSDQELMKKSVVTSDFEKRHAIPCEKSRHKAKKERKMEREKSLGSKWFDLPAGEATGDAKRDLKVLKMRGALDGKRFYKKEDFSQLPKFFQFGRVVEGAGEFYSGRLTRRQQKQSIVEELLADEQFKRYSKKKFLDIQAARSKSGRKFHIHRHKKQKSFSHKRK
eukprot:m.1278 g.1278  ORF g.1278 m.1278 type:complete len:246 (+) comp6006_c0_seq1:54-791(+)